MRLRFAALALLSPLAAAAPARLDYDWQPGQRWSFTGAAEVIELAPDLAQSGLRRMRWAEDLYITADDSAGGGGRVSGFVDERDELQTGPEARLPVYAFFGGHTAPGGMWLGFDRTVDTGDLFIGWSPQLALAPLPEEMPGGEPLAARWPVWIGSTRLEGEFEIQRLTDARVGRVTCDRWRARLREPLALEEPRLRIPTWEIEVFWDEQMGRPLRVRTTATVAGPGEGHQVQAQMTLNLAEVARLDTPAARALPKQLALMADILERRGEDRAAASALAEDFLKTFRRGQFADVLRSMIQRRELTLPAVGDIGGKTDLFYQ
jgi:hypothetical protein